MGRPFSEATREDLRELLRRIEEQPVSEATKMDDRTFVKKFFGWLRGRDFVRDIKVGRWSNRIIPEDVLDPVDVNTMVEACTRIRDRAIVMTLYESGARPQEFLGLKVGSVEFDEYGAVLHLPCGKTGMRRVRVMAAAPLLARYLEQHPFREDPDAPLWLTESTNYRNRPLSWVRLNRLLKEVAKRAGIRKRVRAYLFRHSRATHLATILTEAEMCQFFGWVQGSDMPRVYVHLSGRDVDEKLLEVAGLKKRDGRRLLRPKVCPRCGASNPPNAEFCGRCGMVLDERAAMELEGMWRRKELELERLREKLEKLERIVERMLGRAPSPSS